MIISRPWKFRFDLQVSDCTFYRAMTAIHCDIYVIYSMCNISVTHVCAYSPAVSQAPCVKLR